MPAFVLFEVVGAAIATGLVFFLYPDIGRATARAAGAPSRERGRVGARRRRMSLSDRVARGGIVSRLTPEFEGVFGPETLERFVEESWEQLSATARHQTFVPVLAERFARERLRALAQSEGAVVSEVPEVLFVCVHNAGRSQMAAALLHWRAGGTVHVRSAGSDPGDQSIPRSSRS